MNSKISFIEFVHDPLEVPDQFFRLLSLGEQDEVGRLAVLRDQ